jgi:biopolymer transport protein ExbD
MYRYIRRSRRIIGSTIPEITLTPLIDTALTLLIIFMVTTPMIHNAIKVNLPRGQAKEDTSTKQELIVFIDGKEQLYFNNKVVASNKELITELQKVVGDNQDKVVYLKADETVHWKIVAELLDQMKVLGGVAHVALSTRKA